MTRSGRGGRRDAVGGELTGETVDVSGGHHLVFISIDGEWVARWGSAHLFGGYPAATSG
jgi:hypothetical protein